MYIYPVYFERQYKLIKKNKIKRQLHVCMHVHVNFEFKIINTLIPCIVVLNDSKSTNVSKDEKFEMSDTIAI